MGRANVAVVLAFVTVLGTASASYAQLGGWVSGNAVFTTPAVTTTTQTDSFRCCSPGFTGTFDSKAVYETPGQIAADVGAGLRLGHFGVGLAVSRYSNDQVGTISFSVPHPSFVGRPATASGATQSPMTQNELGVHLEARYIANLPHMSFAVFAGPSYLKTTRSLVSDFRYSSILGATTQNFTVSLTGDTTNDYTVSKWGFNLGVDAGYYFGENFGIGGLARYARATIDLPNPLDSPTATQPYDLGGLSVGGGLRFRF